MDENITEKSKADLKKIVNELFYDDLSLKAQALNDKIVKVDVIEKLINKIQNSIKDLVNDINNKIDSAVEKSSEENENHLVKINETRHFVEGEFNKHSIDFNYLKESLNITNKELENLLIGISDLKEDFSRSIEKLENTLNNNAKEIKFTKMHSIISSLVFFISLVLILYKIFLL